MAINWADIQRQQNKKMAQTARSITDLNNGYGQRENVINGWLGGAGKILLTYSPVSCTAQFGANNSNCPNVGP